MKFIVTGDWHITNKRPENRIDELPILAKLNFVFKTAESYKATILQPGDFFDNANPDYSLFAEVVSLFNSFNVEVLTIFGQHDLRFRNKANTALATLEKACRNLVILPYNEFKVLNGLNIYGSSYNEDIPKIKDRDKFSILLTHRMIIDEKLWKGQEQFDYADKFLLDNKWFDLIVSGDNHKSITSKKDYRYLINCGSLYRSSIKQLEHKPVIYLFDTKDRKVKEIMIPIEPAENVFAVDKVLKEKEIDEKLQAFVSGLSSQKELGLSFEDNLNSYIKKNRVDKEVQEVIWESLK